MRFSKLVITAVILMNIVFTAVVLYIFYRVGNEPAVLIGAWFGFTTAEVWALAFIKRKENNND